MIDLFRSYTFLIYLAARYLLCNNFTQSVFKKCTINLVYLCQKFRDLILIG